MEARLFGPVRSSTAAAWSWSGLRDVLVGGFPRLARLRLVLPAAMEPQVLVGVAADRALQRRGEALCEQAGVVGGAGELVGLDDRRAAHLVMERLAEAAGKADDHGRPVLERQQRDR